MKQIGSVLILDLEQVQTSYREIVRFINREQPAGSCLILILIYPSKEDSFSLNEYLNTSYQAFSVEDEHLNTDTSLNSIIVDSYTAQIDT